MDHHTFHLNAHALEFRKVYFKPIQQILQLFMGYQTSTTMAPKFQIKVWIKLILFRDPKVFLGYVLKHRAITIVRGSFYFILALPLSVTVPRYVLCFSRFPNHIAYSSLRLQYVRFVPIFCPVTLYSFSMFPWLLNAPYFPLIHLIPKLLNDFFQHIPHTLNLTAFHGFF